MKILNKLKNINFQDKEGWIEDAIFGFDNISSTIINKKNFCVLEVGCGLGILLSLIRESYNDVHLDGVEPFELGFDRLNIKDPIIASDVNISHLNFESFKTKKKYDLIYSVNVFEHLTNWKLFLDYLHKWLKKDGVCIILCPNYSFPYESHFKLPIVFNKKLTNIIFRKYILKFEKKNNAQGLWQSLNFIKMKKVERYCKSIKLSCSYDISMFDTIIDRYDSDPAFKERQKLLGKVAKISKNIGLLQLAKLKFFHKYHPYMKLHIKRI